jgi:hypothetical protein
MNEEQAKLETEIRDLSSRLYYCSNSGEGRKMRKWIEKRIRQLEKKQIAVGERHLA